MSQDDGGTPQRVLGTFLSWLQERRGDVLVIATASDVLRLPPETWRGSMSCASIFNYIKVSDAVVTGGQPTVEQFEALAAEGFSAVVNLAPVDPADPVADEAGLVSSLGMAYHHIPVDWDEPKDADLEAFERTMLELPEGKVLIHCVANFRVTAFYSLYALKHLGWSEAQAGELRAMIWEGEDYPVWREFVARWQARIVAG